MAHRRRDQVPSARLAALALAAVVVAVAGCGQAAGRSSAATPQALHGAAASSSPAGGHGVSPASARWATGAPLPVAVSEVGVASLGGQVHVLGGYVAGKAHSRTHLVYDVASGRWRRAAPLPVALDHVGAAVVGSGASARLLSIGGYGSAGPTRAVYAYDATTDAWSVRASLPVARAAGVAVTVSGLVHYIGGRGSQGDTGEHDIYDPARDRWSVATPMPTARDHAAAAAIGNIIYVAAGRPGGKRTLESLDVRSGRWTTGLPPLGRGRSSLAGAAWRGLFVVMGGEDAAETTVYSDVDAYDPSRRTWTRLQALPAGRQGIGAAVVGSVLLLPGGGPAAGGGKQTDTLLELR